MASQEPIYSAKAKKIIEMLKVSDAGKKRQRN